LYPFKSWQCQRCHVSILLIFAGAPPFVFEEEAGVGNAFRRA
jgi:hypothetical protein